MWYENGPKLPSYYYEGDADKSDDVRIGGARRSPGQAAWEKPFVMSDTFGVSDNNPALAIDKQERLWLIHPTLLAVPQKSWASSILWFKISSDYEGPGRPRWDKESVLIVHPHGLDEVVAKLAAELRRHPDKANLAERRAEILLERLGDPFSVRLGWMPRVHPLVLPDGAVLIPFGNENFNVAAMALTRDGGETWTISNTVPGWGISQPSVLRLGGGKLLAFFRDETRDHRIKASESIDGGLTWSQVVNTNLPNPGSGVEALALRNGRLAIVYNDSENSRDRLAISISADGGKTWQWTRHLEKSVGGRFDYPSIIQAGDGALHATYSYNTKTIKHVKCNEAWVLAGDQD